MRSATGERSIVKGSGPGHCHDRIQLGHVDIKVTAEKTRPGITGVQNPSSPNITVLGMYTCDRTGLPLHRTDCAMRNNFNTHVLGRHRYGCYRDRWFKATIGGRKYTAWPLLAGTGETLLHLF